MKKVFAIIFSCILISFVAIAGEYIEKEVKIEKKVEIKENGRNEEETVFIRQNPQRYHCLLWWNKYYKDNGFDIMVLTKGKYDEVVVFVCPECSSEDNFVNPFLATETDGMTGLERVKACGFLKAVFRGSKGTQEIERVVN